MFLLLFFDLMGFVFCSPRKHHTSGSKKENKGILGTRHKWHFHVNAGTCGAYKRVSEFVIYFPPDTFCTSCTFQDESSTQTLFSVPAFRGCVYRGCRIRSDIIVVSVDCFTMQKAWGHLLAGMARYFGNING